MFFCLIYAVISAILSEALVFYALSKGDLSVATVLISTYPIYTLLFSYIINNEILTSLQIIFILITIIGTVLTCIEKDFKLKNIKNGGYLLTFSCSQHMTPVLFMEMLNEAIFDSKRRVQMLDFKIQSPDHPALLSANEQLYLKCVILRVLD